MNNNEFVLDLLALLDKQKSKTQINTGIKDLEKLVRKLRLTATLTKGTTKTQINQIIKQLESQLRQVKIQAKMDQRQLNREINAALRNVSARDIQLNINSNGERLNAQLRRTVSQAGEFVSRHPLSINIDLKKEKLLNQLKTFTNKYTKINESSYWLGEAERLRGVIGSVTNRNELRNAADQFQVFTSGVRATGYAAVSTTDKIKGMIGNVVKVGNYFGMAFTAVNKFRQSLSTLKTNDTILTEISKTSEMTKQQLKELGDEAFNVASKYGQVSGNYLLAVQEMARSGYETLSKELGELSLLTQSAGDMSAEMANNYLLATDAAYKYGGSVESLNAALDGANYISNRNSASLTDIADATRVSASFAANAGVAIDELTAAEAAMIATTKRSGSEMGRAFRSIVLNLQGVSGEFDGEVIDEESLKKVEDRCHSLGVELEYMKDGVATLRNPMEVLKDLAEVYNSLPDDSADKQGLISDIGGKYHANALSALLSRWDLYEKMVGEFSQGTGSALEEAKKTADSWEGRVAQLQNTWDDFVNSLINKDAVKGGVSFLDNTIQAFTKLSDTLGAIPVIMTAVNGSMTALNKNYGITQVINKDTRKMDIQGNFMGIDFTAFKTQKKHFSEAEIAIASWNNCLADGTTNIDAFNNATVQNNEQLKAYLATTSAEAPASLSGYKAYLNAAGVSTDALRLKTVLLNSAITMGLSVGIQLVVAGISKLVNAENEAVQSAKEAADTYKESSSSMNDYISKYSELREQLLAAKGSEEETYNVKRQLLDLQTELNEKYGEEHGYLNLVTDAYKDQTEAIKELNKESANKFLNENEQGISTAKRKMESHNTYDLSYAIARTGDNEKIMYDIVDKYKKDGMSVLDAGESFYIKLDANPEDAYETINSFLTDVNDKAKELGNENLFKNTVSNMASDSLNKAKETLDKHKEIYNQAKMAHIASDDNLSEGYNEAVSAVKAYNEAVLKSEDAYNDENVNNAWNNLQTVKQGIKDNEAEWGKYSSIMDDVFSAANDDVYSFYQALKNDTGITKLAEKLKGLSDVDLQAMDGVGNNGDSFDILYAKAEKYGLEVQDLIDLLVRLGYVQGEISKKGQEAATPLSFKDAWASLDTTENDSLKSLKDDLLSLAETGQLTIEAFTETKGSDTFLSQLGIESDDTQEINSLISQINKLKSSADQLSSMKKGISSLSENLYSKQQEPGKAIDADVLAGMDEELKEQTAEWEKYVTVLGDASSSMDDVQKATDDLATAYVNSSNFLANLTDANKDYYVSQLDAMGVANAEAVVQDALAQKYDMSRIMAEAMKIVEDDLANSKYGVTEAAVVEISKLLEEENAAYGVRNAVLAAVEAAKIFASTDLGISEKLSQMESLIASTCGLAAAMEFASKTGGYDEKGNKLNTGGNASEIAQEIISQARAYVKPSVAPANPSNKNGGSSKTPKKEETEKEFEETFDWIERRIKRFQKAFDRWLKQAETAVTTGFLNKYYKKAASYAENELSAYSSAYSRYMAQADSVGLSEAYASKVRAGAVDIETIKNEALADKVKKYQDYYDKAQDSMDSFLETAEKLYNLPLEKAAKKIEIFSGSIDLLGRKIDNAIGSKNKNKFVDKQTAEEKRTLNAYKQARTESKKSLDSAKKELRKTKNLDADDGITAEERSRIKSAMKNNKEVNLAFFHESSAGYQAAVKYNEALKANKKAADDAALAQQDYNKWLVESAKLKFDNIADDYHKKVQKLGYDMSALDNKVSELETAGKKIDRSYYESQKKVNNKTLKQYNAEKTALEKNIQNIRKGTDEWYDAKDAIQEVNNAISECVKEAYELNNAINQLYFDLFGSISDSISRIITEQEFLQGLFAHEKNADKETGNFTDAGLAKLGSLSAGYYASKNNADRDKAMLEDLQNVKGKGKQADGSYKLGKWEFNSLEDLQAKIDETYTKWQDDIKETYRLESSIVDVMKEKYQAELDLLQELIDAKKEALNAEKDLHDYQKTLNEKTESISTIQKQIAAYSGDTSQEGLAKLQKLQKELADKQEDLRETEYDRYISDQQEMLDKLYEEYEELMAKKLDDFMTLVKEGLETSNDNSSAISSFLSAIASANGYTQETKGLFGGISDGIKTEVDRIISAIAKEETDQSKTEESGIAPSKAGSNGSSPKEIISSQPKELLPSVPKNPSSFHQEKQLSPMTEAETAKSYIARHADKAGKKKKEYSDVNQKIYENKSKAYKGTGKVLSTKELKGLADSLGVGYDNGSKKGTLYKKLKSIRFPGFKRGGIAKLIKDNGEDGLTLARNGEGFIAPEHVKPVQDLVESVPKISQLAESIVPAQTDIMQKFAEHMPEFIDSLKNTTYNAVEITNPIEHLRALSNARSMNNITVHDIHYNLELPNVIDEKSFLNAMQSSTVEKCLETMTIKQMNNIGKLTKRHAK